MDGYGDIPETQAFGAPMVDEDSTSDGQSSPVHSGVGTEETGEYDAVQATQGFVLQSTGAPYDDEEEHGSQNYSRSPNDDAGNVVEATEERSVTPQYSDAEASTDERANQPYLNTVSESFKQQSPLTSEIEGSADEQQEAVISVSAEPQNAITPDAEMVGGDHEVEESSDAKAVSDVELESENHVEPPGTLITGQPKIAHSVASDSDVDAADDERPSLAVTSHVSPTHEDLFGDADDVSTSSDEGGEEKIRSRRNSAASLESGAKFEQDDIRRESVAEQEAAAEEELEAAAETLIEVEIPKISAELGSQPHFVKFPNFLGVEPRPFDPDTYEDEIDDDDVLDEEGRSRVKLKVENTIRWRQIPGDGEGGTAKRCSNAKIVRWSDGSMSLYLGAEVFDVHTHPLQGDHHHLFIRQGTGLQGKAIFRTKLTFRPHSTESFTHRKMTISMADRTSKAQKVKVLPAVGKDPETMKLELMKKEEERLRASARREAQQRRSREKSHGRGLSAGYLEPDRDESDGENTVSISAIKKRYKAGMKDFAAARAIYASSDEESNDEAAVGGADSDDGGGSRRRPRSSAGGGERRLERAKRLADSDEDEADAEERPESAADDVGVKARRRPVIEDDDEEEDGDDD